MPPLSLEDPDSLRRAYVEESRSLSAIAESAGCSYATVRRALLAQGVEIRRSGPAPIATLRDKEWLGARVREGLSATDIAERLGCAEATVRAALRWAGLNPRAERRRPPALDDASFLERAYATEGRSVRSIADQLGCTKDMVLLALRRHDIAVRGRGRSTTSPATVPDTEPAVAMLPLEAQAPPVPDEPPVPVPEAQPVDVDPEEAVITPQPLRPARPAQPREQPDGHLPIADNVPATEPVLADAGRPWSGDPSRLTGRGPAFGGAGSFPTGRVELEIEKIETKTFPVSRRGYDRAEVDAFLRAIAEDYRRVVRTAREAVSAAQQAAQTTQPPPSPPPSSPSFADVGGQVATVLNSAAQAAEEMKASAEKEAAAIRHDAREELMQLRQAAMDDLAEAEKVKAATDEEANAIVAAARAEAGNVLAAARREAARVEESARQQAVTLEHTAHANVDAVIAEARREYEHLRSVQQQCVDRLASVEFLARHAREGLSETAGQPLDELLS